jgi:hypothetical protein
MNMALLGLMDMIGYAGVAPILSRIDARRVQTCAFACAATALLVCSLLPHGSQASIVCALAGRLFIDVAFTTIYLLAVECFPTQCCSAVLGIANFVSRLCSLGAPFLALIPFVLSCQILGALGVIAAVATWTLPCAQKGATLNDRFLGGV